MGKVLSTVLRPIKTFNLENRAHRVIGRDPIPAPRHPSNKADLKRAQEVAPDFLEKHNTKDPGLDNRLKDVFVKSQDPWGPDGPAVEARYNPKKPLPTDRKAVPIFDYGQKEPDYIPPGRIVLREALNLLWQNQQDPEKNTAQSLAAHHNLQLQHVEDLIAHYKVFQLYLPETNESGQELRVSYASDLKKLDPPEPEPPNPKKEKFEKITGRTRM